MDQDERNRIRAEAKAHLDDTWTPERFPSPPVQKSVPGPVIRTEPIVSRVDGHGNVVGVPISAAEPAADVRVRYAFEYGDDEWSEEARWNRWLADNLKYERKLNYKVVGEVMREQDAEHAEQIRKLELKIAELNGKLDLISKHLGKGRRR